MPPRTVPVELLVGADGSALLPSHSRDAAGSPRFALPLIRELIGEDPGLRYIVLHESLYGGYEAATRLFFDEHLRPGDVFIDVGAHWGVFSLSAATRWPGRVSVVAVEPHPFNAVRFLKSIDVNGLHGQIDLVPAAAGAERAIGALRCAGSMGHALAECAGQATGLVLHVPIVPLDEILTARSDLMGRRTFLKVDVEGYELEVLRGAHKLLRSGAVQALMWEKGDSYAAGAGLGKLAQIVDELGSLGFTLHRFPSTEFGGPLIPFAPTLESGNVFALGPGFERKPCYSQPFALQPPFNTKFALPADAATRERTTRLLQQVRGSDGARWADPDELRPGAQVRADTVASLIAPPGRVLDLGAGAMALAAALAEGCGYAPADLIARSAECAVVDLNQGQFPPGRFDAVTMLELLEYMHDVPALLARARACAPRLICTYHPLRAQTAAERRQRGWFNDFTEEAFTRILARAGWRPAIRKEGDFGVLYDCKAASN